MMKSKRPTLRDVAREADVSYQTVSRVINNHPRVAPKTAQSVRAAMQNLGYTPSDRRPGPKPSESRASRSEAEALRVWQNDCAC